MDLFPLVLAGHLVGDWVVQTDRQAAGKVWPQPMAEAVIAVGAPMKVTAGELVIIDPGTPKEEKVEVMRSSHTTTVVVGRPGVRRHSWKLNQQHMLTYHLTLLLALVWAVSLSHLAVIIAVSWVTHSIIDRRWTVRWLMAHTGSKAFSETTWGVIAVDQALHLAILSILAAVL